MTPEDQQTVLVVEDHLDSRELLCSVLRHEGYKVIEAGDGKYAILEASREHPDLILMDLAMPEMDGVEAARRILKVPKLANTPIVAVTAYATDEVKADVISAGCKEVLEKPININVLLEKIRLTLNPNPSAQKAIRRVERVQVSIPVNWGIAPEDYKYDGTITSLSVNGCLVQTNIIETFYDKLIFLRFRLPSGNWMPLRGRVLYYLNSVGFGMEFMELAEDDRAKLKLFVEYCRQEQAL
jgi:CheY-like chemotaxis protein